MERKLRVEITPQDGREPFVVAFPISDVLLSPSGAWRDGVAHIGLDAPLPFDELEVIAYAINEGSMLSGVEPYRDEEDEPTSGGRYSWRVLNPKALPDFEWRDSRPA